MMNAPLAGLKVIEAANFLAGPMSGMILADLGAEVVKVEPPRGDPYRRFGRVYGDSGLVFKAANQNKRSVALDLKSDAGFASLLELLADADVLITNWRPGVAERMGLTGARVRDEFPQLIWVRVSGYGPDGPRAGLPAFDGIVQARSGAMLSGVDTPTNVNSNVADKVSAMFAAQTVTAALHQRSTTGTGSVCDMPMVDAMAYFYGADISAGHRIEGQDPDPAVSAAAAGDATFETADGWLTLSPVTGKQLRRAMEAAGVGDQFGDVMDADRSTTFDVFAAALAPALLERSADEWEPIFVDADVPASAIRTFDQHMHDEQMIHNQTYQSVEDPSVDGNWLLVRYPSFFDGQRAETAGLPSPKLDSQ
jgi:crotonobetainyl-CoA:carnitine CoA-transferase CaiB-like acyl-CoA transferase